MTRLIFVLLLAFGATACDDAADNSDAGVMLDAASQD